MNLNLLYKSLSLPSEEIIHFEKMIDQAFSILISWNAMLEYFEVRQILINFLKSYSQFRHAKPHPVYPIYVNKY